MYLRVFVIWEAYFLNNLCYQLFQRTSSKCFFYSIFDYRDEDFRGISTTLSYNISLITIYLSFPIVGPLEIKIDDFDFE